jgi:hypothetical protein
MQNIRGSELPEADVFYKAVKVKNIVVGMWDPETA